jgi:hypothetical protein
MDYRDVSVDHVIPESLIAKPDDLAKVKAEYGLNEAFDLNDYANWLPAHDRCNRSKNDKILTNTPLVTEILKVLSSQVDATRKAAETIRARGGRGKLVARLKSALDSGMISSAELEALIVEETGTGFDRGLLRIVGLRIDSIRWKVIALDGDLATVTDGTRVGVTPVGDAAEWLCPNCFSEGPWNGVICQSCGHRNCD